MVKKFDQDGTETISKLLKNNLKKIKIFKNK